MRNRFKFQLKIVFVEVYVNHSNGFYVVFRNRNYWKTYSFMSSIHQKQIIQTLYYRDFYLEILKYLSINSQFHFDVSDPGKSHGRITFKLSVSDVLNSYLSMFFNGLYLFNLLIMHFMLINSALNGII